jgi:hypothetical protein
MLIEYVYTRTGGISTDASYADRYQISLDAFLAFPQARQMFGIGIGNNELGAQFGSYGSTYSYLLIHMGLIFSLLLLGLVCWQLRRVYHVGARALLFLFVLLMGTYQVTFVTFWFVLAALATLERAAHIEKTVERYSMTYGNSTTRLTPAPGATTPFPCYVANHNL